MTTHNNDSRPKGRIDIPSHIRENQGQFNGRIAYEFREHTTDNALNHMIILTYERLYDTDPSLAEKVFSDKDNCVDEIIDDIRKNAPSVPAEMTSATEAALDKPVTSDFFEGYEELRILCQLIWSGSGISPFAESGDTGTDMKGLLFYLPDLWEEYTGKLIIESGAFSGDNDKVMEQKEIRLFHNDKEELNAIFNGVNDVMGKHSRRPDFVLQKNEKIIAVLDAKFKRNWFQRISQEGNIEDLLEDADKCIRDMALCGAWYTGVIYPYYDSKEYNGTVYFADIGEGTGKHFCFCRVKIPLPKNDDYGSWLGNMGDSENAFKKGFEKFFKSRNKDKS